MKLIQATLFWYLAGRMFFFACRAIQWDEWNGYDTWYYLWDRINYAMLFGTILYLMPKSFRWLLWPVFILQIILFVWEIVNISTNLGINHPSMVANLFTILLVIVLVLLGIDLWKRAKER